MRRRNSRSRRRWSAFRSVPFWVSVTCLFFSTMLISVSYKKSGGIRLSSYREDNEVVFDLSNNYFQPMSDLINGSFLVKNEKCLIPDMDAWDRLVQPLIAKAKPSNCNSTHLNLTYVDNSMVVINEEVLNDLGYELDDISCCYNSVERVNQFKYKYDKEADNLFRYSEPCYKMDKVTMPRNGFIKVTCIGKRLLGNLSYKTYHLIPLFSNGTDGNGIPKRKQDFWKKCSVVNNYTLSEGDNACTTTLKFRHPPNILILGIDSTSRINFRRFMPRTVKVLEEKLQAHELRGYTKVGENTFPNFIPLMTSYSEDELRKRCYINRWVPQDSCPLIWKKFAQHKYLTVHLEDSPKMAIFNYMKTGFIKSPVDIYLRPFMMAAYKDQGYPYTLGCIGNKRPEELIFEYISSLISLANSSKIPYFITSWLTDLTHDNMNNLQTADGLFAQTLQTLHKNGFLNNTVLFLMSDHGYRFLKVRATTSGWYEDKMPAVWVRLPPSIAEAHPDWEEALLYNSRELLTPFDLHETLRELLSTYTNYKDSVAGNLENGKESSRGKSILQKVPSRTCNEAGVPGEYCTCEPPFEYKANSTFIKLAAEAVVKSINRQLPSSCRQLSLGSVTASGTKYLKNGVLVYSENHLPEKLVVAIKTKPGNFKFEAWVTYNKTSGEFSDVSRVLRMTTITTSTSCLSDKEVRFETLCFCDTALSMFYK